MLIYRANSGNHPEGGIIVEVPDHLARGIDFDQLRETAGSGFAVMALPITNIESSFGSRIQLGDKEQLSACDIVGSDFADDFACLVVQLDVTMGIAASHPIVAIL